jgi:hypothetical protein
MAIPVRYKMRLDINEAWLSEATIIIIRVLKMNKLDQFSELFL